MSKTSSEAVNAMDQAAAKLINKALEGVDAAVGFLSEQIPDVVRQLLIWEMSWSIFMAMAWIGAIFFFFWLKNKAVAYGENERDDIAIFIGGGAMYMASFASALLAIFNIKVAAMIAIAPKVYLIKYAADLVK